MSEEKMRQMLESMRGATLRGILFGVAAVRLEFAQGGARPDTIFRLKSANVFSVSERPTGNYETEMLLALPVLYRALDHTLDGIVLSDARAELRFSNGSTLYIHDLEKLWDNLFALEVEGSDGRFDYLYS